MTDFDAFYNYLSEQLYGEDYSKHDKSNLKNKLQPVFENEKILEIKDKRLSMIFLESFFMKFVSDNEKRELLRFYKDKCKELKNDNNDYDYINNLYQGKVEEFKDVNENMREKLSKQLRTKITKELETEHKEELKLLKNKLKKTTQMYRKAQEELNEYKLEKELEE